MKEIIALQEYSDKYISLYEGEIRNIQNSIADKLIQQGVVAEHGDSEGGDLEQTTVVTCDIDCKDYMGSPDNQRHDIECEYSFDEICDMLKNGKIVIAHIYSSTIVNSIDIYIPFNFNSGFLAASKVNEIIPHQNTLLIRMIDVSNLYPGDKSLGLTRYEYKVPIATS